MLLSIDLGTCFARASYLSHNKIIQVKSGASHTGLYPSSAYLDSTERILVGQDAEQKIMSDPINYRRYFMLELGSKTPYPMHGQIYPETLVEAMMWKLRQDAGVAHLQFDTALITTHSSFASRPDLIALLKKCAQRVNFNSAQFLPGPIALTTYYASAITKGGLQDKEAVLVFDIGGTFDAAIIQKQGTSYITLGHMPTTKRLGGGIEIDKKIYQKLTQQLLQTHPQSEGLLDMKNLSREALQARLVLRIFCRDLKHRLGNQKEVQEIIPPVLPGVTNETLLLTARELRQMTTPILEEAIQYSQRLILDAKNKGVRNIHCVLLSGGSSRIPWIKAHLQETFQLPIVHLTNLDTGLCQGGALYEMRRESAILDPLSSLVRAFSKELASYFKAGSEQPRIVQLMTYEKAIEYFITNRPPDPRAEKGALLRQPHSQGQVFTQVFLDNKNHLVCLPYSRQLIVQAFDEELIATFGDKQLIIVE